MRNDDYLRGFNDGYTRRGELSGGGNQRSTGGEEASKGTRAPRNTASAGKAATGTRRGRRPRSATGSGLAATA